MEAPILELNNVDFYCARFTVSNLIKIQVVAIEFMRYALVLKGLGKSLCLVRIVKSGIIRDAVPAIAFCL